MARNRARVQPPPGRRSGVAAVGAGSAIGASRRREQRPASSLHPTPTARRPPTAQRRPRSRAHHARHARRDRKARGNRVNGNHARQRLRLEPRRTASNPKPKQLWLRTPTPRWLRPTVNQRRRNVVAVEAVVAAGRSRPGKRQRRLETTRNLRPRRRPNLCRSNRRPRQAARRGWPRALCARRSNSNAGGDREGS